jgi:hypothetical protein
MHHPLTSALALTPIGNNGTSYQWATPDHSDGELRQQVFTIKFKTIDEASQFRDAYVSCGVKVNDVVASTPTKAEAVAVAVAPKQTPSTGSLCNVSNCISFSVFTI